MKMLILGTDRKILDKDSAVSKRVEQYAGGVSEMHVIVSAFQGQNGRRSGNMTVHSTGSLTRWLFPIGLLREGIRVLREYTGGDEWVISTQDPAETGFIGYVLSRLFRIPLEVQVHGDIWSPYYVQGNLLNYMRRVIARFVLPHADCVRAVSERVARSLVEHGVRRGRIHILPIHVELRGGRSGERPKEYSDFSTVILLVSRLEVEKDIMTALQAFRRIEGKYPDTGLVIVGEGSERKKLEEYVRKHELSNRVIFTGWKDTVGPYYEHADIYLLTSLHESYGRTLLEAASGGCAVVSTDIGIIGEIFESGKDALVCPPKDVRCIADKLSFLLGDEEERVRIARHAQKTVVQNTVDFDEYRNRMWGAWKKCASVRPKVCYVLPQYDESTDTHFTYLYDLIQHASGDLDMFLIIERAQSMPHFDVSKTYVKKSHSYILRILEGLWISLRARISGYRQFYVHYSFIGALSAIVVTKLFGGRVLYWNCGMPWLYNRGWFEESVFRFILRNTELVTGTKSLGRMYAEEYALKLDRIHVLPNWIDVEGFRAQMSSREDARERLNIPQNAHVVLFVHHLSERKGADQILPVVRRLKKEDVLFLVCGDGPYFNRLKKEVKERELGEKVRLEGCVPQRRIPLYFSAADLFFMPSEEEGFPHVLLESMAAGVSYVASDVGGVRDISPNEGAYLIDDQNADAFSKAIKDALSSSTSRKDLSGEVDQYDIQKVSRIFNALFV